MTARILNELSVGLTPEINEALQIACGFSGMKPSQYARQAVLHKLVAEGFMQHPMQKIAAQQQQTA